MMGKDKLKSKHSFYGGREPGKVLPVETRFEFAVNHFRNGRLEDAKILLQEILSTDPKHAESWFFTALIADHEGLHQYAFNYLENALAIDPKNLKYLYTLGDICCVQNYVDEGVKLFEFIIKISPDDWNGYYNLAVMLQKQKKYEKALLNYHKVLELDKKNINAMYDIGNILIDLKDFINAVSYFEKVIEAQPNSDDAFNNLGFLHCESGDLEIAIEYLNKAILINPENFNALNNLGKAHEKKGLFLDALGYFEKAIILKPEFAGSYSNRGSILNELKQFDAALIDFDKAISLNPDFSEAHSNRGNALKEMMRLEDALNAYERAITLSPNYAEAYSNRGVVLQELSRIMEAMASYDRAIFLDPDYGDAYNNKALLLLSMQNLEAGWLIYNEWRWEVKDRSLISLKTKLPKWNGKIDENRNKILFWAEQGLGDEVFYFGMLKNFAEINAKITIASDNRLHALIKRSMPEVEVVDRKKIFSECDENLFDYQAPIGDVGRLFAVDGAIEHKAAKPFFSINKFRSDDIKNKNHKFADKIVCGLSWRSGNKNIGFSKSIELIEFSPLLLIEGLEFVSLQSGPTKDEIDFVEKKIGKKIHTVEDLDIYNDIDGLVSLIDACDFVITTSNITAHLTGAVGKKGMVLLPRSKGKVWYWHSGVGQSIWYPSLQLASQKQMNDWTDPMNKCKKWILEQL
jgi:tetratricopeptide (TPR) repeat protein